MSDVLLNKQFWNKGLKCIHTYVGILVAPFILIAAFTGVLYGLTPQIEKTLYKNYLIAHHALDAKPQPLSLQVQRAQQLLPSAAHIMAVRPAEDTDATTRVMYMDHNSEQMMAVFINPYTLSAQGKLAVYGTSGVLPMRTFLDHLHRELLLGSLGRIYSELAASWLGILACTGLIQWIIKRRHNALNYSSSQKKHMWIGLLFLPMLLFFSITGLTWSNWAGQNIAQIRHFFKGDTPTLNTSIDSTSKHQVVDLHAEHHMLNMHSKGHITLEYFDGALSIAREQGLTANRLQIKPSDQKDRAWVVQEINHQWPIQVDEIAINMQTKKVVDRLFFEKFPLSAKLTRWGVDLHIGVLFGWVNQAILVLSGLAICFIILYVYIPWLLRGESTQIFLQFGLHMKKWWQSGCLMNQMAVVAIIGALYFFIPVWFFSVVIFISIVMILSIYEHYTTK